ncbi:MAG TPA: PfkB family carbohydrate kinase, partial [Frankiaceae bacterium]|nr:PfkB family carbohydrate kinase [Frankiaceae bacterium]
GTATVIVDRAGENLIAVASGANALLDAEAAAQAVGAAAGPGQVVLLDLEVPLAAVVAAAEAAVRVGATVVLDPAPAPAGPLPKRLVASCAVLTPNEHELPAGGPAELIGAGAAAVVVTLGAAGAELHRPGRPPLTRPALPAAVVDTTGAGDAFTAALGWALAGGLDLADAVLVATAAGAAATEAVGARAGLPTRDELARRLAGRLATTLPG